MKKRFLILLLTFCTTLSMPTSVFAKSTSSTNPYAPYKDFKELYETYQQAVEENNIELQNELEQIATDTLHAEMQEMPTLDNPILRADPDDQYWKGQFSNYFSYGYFQNTGNWNLALMPKDRGIPWTATKKSNGWNSVYSKFRTNSHWANTTCMKEQFYCHARLFYATAAGEWNLEPWKTSISSITCN